MSSFSYGDFTSQLLESSLLIIQDSESLFSPQHATKLQGTEIG